MGSETERICFHEVAFSVLSASFLCMVFYNMLIPACLLFLAIWVCYSLLRKQSMYTLPTQGKYVLITGCDTGFGNSIARQLDKKGMHVFATCLSTSCEGAVKLKETGSSRMKVLQLDVSKDDSVAACLEKVHARCSHQGLWALVNNAGTTYRGDIEVQLMEYYKTIYDINALGMVRTCKAFLPLIRKCKGRVVNITSVRGLVAIHRDSVYAMSKFAAEAFSDCLRQEMVRFGVKVIVIEPSNFGLSTATFSEENREHFKAAYEKSVSSVSEDVRRAYGEDYLQTYFDMPRMKTNISDSDLKGVLDAVEEAVLNKKPQIRYLVPGTLLWLDEHAMLARLKPILPEWVMDQLIFKVIPFPNEAWTSSWTDIQSK